MPEFSIKEFGEQIGKEPKQVHTLIARNKIIKNDRKKIDTSNEINRLYLEQNKVNGESPKINGTSKGKKEKEVNPPKPAEPSEHSLILQEKARIELEQKKLALENSRLENEKKRGELVSLQDTINTVKSYSDGLKRELDQNIQTFIQDICARHGIDSGKMGEYKLKVADIINKSNKTAIELLLKNL